jgi:nucleoside-diphosphate-sugar epimerase
MPEALVFGASGQIGSALLPLLRADGWDVVAVSRTAHAHAAGVRWLRGDLAECHGLPDVVDAIFSCGPLDHFARWYALTQLRAPRVVAFGSTSASVKQASGDAGERELARRLGEGERAVLGVATRRDARATLLRPTLLYGAGRDQTLSRLARFALRWRALPIPRGATGLRQPVHVDDLAAAAFAVLDRAATAGRAYALPGGETLAYRDMVARMLATLPGPPRLLELPPPLFALANACMRVLGRDAIAPAAVARLREDLVFDAGPANRDFGYAPRAFVPTRDMFAP